MMRIGHKGECETYCGKRRSRAAANSIFLEARSVCYRKKPRIGKMYQAELPPCMSSDSPAVNHSLPHKELDASLVDDQIDCI